MSAVSGNEKLLYSVDERPPLWLALLLGFQHVIVIYGEIVLFPLVVGHLTNADEGHVRFACFAAAVAASISTVIQTLRFRRYGSGYTIFMGSSTAYLACSVAAVNIGGFPLLATLSIIVAPLEALFAYFIRFLRNIVTPAVGGIVLLLIVISLLPVSVKEWVGKKSDLHYASPENLITGLITMVVLLGIALFGSRRLRLWCPLIGLTAGFATAWHLGILNFKNVYDAPWFGLLSVSWPGLVFDIKAEHLSVLAAMAVVTIINGVQAIGNSMAVQQVSERDFKKVDYDRIQGCMYADSAGNVVSGILGTVPNETYCENISILNITGVASRLVGLCGAAIMALLAFSPKISIFLIEMPQPVFGGFLMGLAAMMFPSGMNLISEGANSHQNDLLIGISLTIGMVAESGTFFAQTLPPALTIFTNSAVAAGGLTAVILSILFSLFRKNTLSFQVDVREDKLTELMEILDSRARELRIESASLYRLQLACEEVFIHIVEDINPDEEEQMSFNIRRDEDSLHVEIRCYRKVTDVDHPSEGHVYHDMDVSGIRLSLLQKITEDLKHLYISGNTYISFKIPLSR